MQYSQNSWSCNEAYINNLYVTENFAITELHYGSWYASYDLKEAEDISHSSLRLMVITQTDPKLNENFLVFVHSLGEIANM